MQQLFCVEIWRRRLVSHLHVMLAISVMFFSLGSSLYTWHDFLNIVMSASQGRNLMVIPLSSHLLLSVIPFLGYLISGGVCNRPPKSSTKIRMLTGSGIRLGLIACNSLVTYCEVCVFLYSNPDVASITKQKKTTPVHFYIPENLT